MATKTKGNLTAIDEKPKPYKEEKAKEEASQASVLDGLIHNGKRLRPRRTLIHGVHGIGKSTLASQADKAIFLPTEEGLNDIDCDSFPLCLSFDNYLANLRLLATQDHDYKTVVTDSLDWLEALIWVEVCHAKQVKQIDEIGYQKGYAAALEYWDQAIKGWNYLREKKDMAIILIAHSRVEKVENPEGENYSRHGLALHKHASALVQEWCDEVLFASYKTYTKVTEEAFGKKTAKAVGGDERTLRTQERPYCLAKNRLNMPNEIPLKWSEYASFFPKH